MKNKIGTAVGIGVGLLVYLLVSHFVFPTQSIDKVLTEAANELNKSCPLMVDQYTRLDNTIALPDDTFVYNYTLVGSKVTDIDVESLSTALKPQILNNVRTNPDMKFFRDKKVKLVYSYKDIDGIFIMKIPLDPSDYE